MSLSVNKTKFSLFFIILALLILPGCQTYRFPSPLSGVAPSQQGQPYNLTVQAKREILPNGLTFILKEDHRFPLVAIEVMVKVGSSSEGNLLGTGVSHFIEHMIFKGTLSRGPGEIEREIRSYGGQISASTSFDYTSFRIIVPKQYAEEAIELLADCLMNPSFEPQELEKERRVILNEMRLNRDDPYRRINQLFFSTAYIRHPYKYPVIGIESLFRKLTRKNILEFHKSTYLPNNMVLAVVGDIQINSIKKKIKGTFGDFPEGGAPTKPSPEEPAQKGLRKKIVAFDGNAVYFLMGFHSTNITSSDLYPLDALAVILGSGKSSRLNEEISRKRRLADFVETWNYTPKEPGIFCISAIVKPKGLDETIQATLDELESIKSGFIQEEELAKAKRKILSDYLFGQQTLESQANIFALNEAIADDYTFSVRYLEGINSVRKKDILKAARKYLNKENLSIVALLPKSLSQNSIKQQSTFSRGQEISAPLQNYTRRNSLPNPGGKPYVQYIERKMNSNEQQTTKYGQEISAPLQNYTRRNSLLRAECTQQEVPETGGKSYFQQIDKQINSNEQHTTKYGQKILKFNLPNGLRLLLMEDHTLPIVTIRAVFKGGLRAEAEQNNGICNLMSNLLLKGTKTKSSSEIAKAIECRGGKIYSFSGANSFGISIDLLNVDIEIGLKLLGDILNNPTFPFEEIEIQKGEILSQIKSQGDDIFHISLRLLKETLFKSHPYGFESLGTEKTIEGITREELMEFYQDLVIPNNMILAVFGDINFKKIQSIIEKDFGSIPKKEPGRINPIVEEPLEGIREAKAYLPSKEEAVIMIGFPTLSIYDGDRYVLEVISCLLSGEKGRLFDRIREQAGLAYAVGSYSVPGIEPGYYNFYASTTPPKINEVRELITEVVNLLKITYVADDELLRAKRELIGQHYIRLQRSGELALRCALDELYGLGYNYYRNYPQRINIITKEDIRRVANKYFPSDRYASITVMPEKK